MDIRIYLIDMLLLLLLNEVREISGQCIVQLPPLETDKTEEQSLIIACQTSNACNKPIFVLWRKCEETGETTCQDVAKYYPSDNSLETFSYNGYDIKGRSYADPMLDVPGVGTITSLNITTLIAKDNGTWGCSTQEGESDTTSLIVNVPPSDVNLVPEERYLISNDSMDLTLTVNRVNPIISIKWLIDNIEMNETSSRTEINDGAWKIVSTFTDEFFRTDTLIVQCFAYFENGTKVDLTEEISFELIASPSIDDPMDDRQEEPYVNSEFGLSCIASGGSPTEGVTRIEWIKDGVNLPIENPLYKEPVETRMGGSYPYGQTEATKSEISWKQPDKSSCSSVLQHNGDYHCNAIVNAGSITSSDVSPSISVDVVYGPLGNMTESETNLNSDGTNAFQFTCQVCARPLPVFTWKYKDGDLPKDVVNFGNGTIQINTVECGQCGTYTCRAENDHGSINIQINVIEPIVQALTVGEIVGIVLGCVAGVGLISALVFLLMRWKKKKQQADEEVVAYAESGNTGGDVANNSTHDGNTSRTPPVYAEIDRDKKKKNPRNSTGNPVYSEVKKDHKKQATTAEQTGPVYSQVNKPGHRQLPQLKPKLSTGSTNTGPVYSKVNKQKQGRLTPIEAQHYGGGNEYEKAVYIGGAPLPPISARHYDNAGQRNEHDGLHYADVDILRQGNGGTRQSHGMKNHAYEPTEYAQIDHRKSAGIVV